MPLPQLLYAQVIKTVRRRRLVRVSHRVVFGTLEAVEQVLAACGWQINTAFIERLNLSIRQHVAAIGRRVTTLCKHEDGVRQQLVAYLLAADKYSGPLASWLIDINQPVIRTRNAFSILRLTQLVCIRAHFSHFTPRSSSLTVTQTVCGWGHGGTRYNSTSLRLHT
jgi:hypothetical protein